MRFYGNLPYTRINTKHISLIEINKTVEYIIFNFNAVRIQNNAQL